MLSKTEQNADTPSDLPYDDIHHVGQRIGDDQGGMDCQDSLQGLGGPHELPGRQILNVLEGLELRVDLQGVSVLHQSLTCLEGLELGVDLQGCEAKHAQLTVPQDFLRTWTPDLTCRVEQQRQTRQGPPAAMFMQVSR